jgi:acetyl/propionyl-CoA carboxylase alpha subunit
VTEAAWDLNLIREQIQIAAGEPLSLELNEGGPRRHAIECRINAEDPARGFLPSTGTVHLEELPGGHGVRVDAALHDGMTVSPYYDSLLAKLITWGDDREEARVRMQTALRRFRVSGVATTRDLVARVVAHPAFVDGDLSTGFLERYGLV